MEQAQQPGTEQERYIAQEQEQWISVLPLTKLFLHHQRHFITLIFQIQEPQEITQYLLVLPIQLQDLLHLIQVF